MEWFELSGGVPLCGSIALQGSKNAALPLLAGAILHRGRTTLHNIPDIRDVAVMVDILRKIGCSVIRKGGTLEIDASRLCGSLVDPALGGQMRSSIMLLGSLIARRGEAVLPYPGGCVIGMRPIDLHVTAMKRMGASFEERDGLLYVKAKKLLGDHIVFHFPSVGATENVILAAVLAEGVTTIENCAREPEIAELCRFLRGMGARISGEGTSCISIEGVAQLADSEWTLMPDRIVAGTYLMGAAATRGKIFLQGAEREDLDAVLRVLKEMGAEIRCIEEGIWMDGSHATKPVPLVCTEPFPGFPTDLQSQLLVALCLADGTSVVRERIFEKRFRIASQLCRMGARVTTDGTEAVVEGVTGLCGADVTAKELRGGAALVIAGLAAKGTTRVFGCPFIERGYEDIARDLRKLGGRIVRRGCA